MSDTPPRFPPRSQPTPVFSVQKLSPARRRMLPAAAAASAAMTLAGCAMSGGSSQAPAPIVDMPTAAAVTPQKNAEEMVRRYTENLDLALDHVDRERLRVAAEKKNTPALTPAAASAAPVGVAPVGAAATPAIIPEAAAPPISPTVSESVLFATSTPEASSDHNGHAAAAATATPAPAAAPQPLAVASASAAGTASVAAKSAVPVGTPAVLERASEQVTLANATPPASIIEKAAPAAVKAPAVREAQAAPLSSQTATNGASIITPITIAPNSTPAAMTSMSAAAPAAPVAEATPVVTTPVSAPPPPAPVAAPEPSMDDAMAIVKKKVSANPSLNSALALALLDPAESADLVKALPESDQKIFTDLLAALQGMNSPAGAASTAERAAPLVNVAKKWQADADLALPKLVLASRVDSFGVYNAIEPKFEQGRRQTVIIYCEVSNFASTKGDDNWFNTKLTQQETLVTDDGLNLLVWRSNPDEIEDRSLNQRRDFYLVKKLTIPENLAAGKYTLIMSVTDKGSGKHATMNLPIEIVTK